MLRRLNVHFRLVFDAQDELSKWKTSFEDVIAQSLGDDNVFIYLLLLLLLLLLRIFI